MLRKDVKFMLDCGWEPKVPPVAVIRKQSEKFAGRLSGSVRLARGLVIGKEYKAKADALMK